jgi:amidophosphoribosyltransferase
MLRNAGATEVHVRISSPPFMWPCYFCTDIPDSEQLTACHYSIEGIRELIEADSLAFLDRSDLCKLAGTETKNFCDACFSGDYPVSPPEKDLEDPLYIK